MTTKTTSDPWRWTLGLFALGNLANGLWMLADPAGWYARLPAAVPDTGPLNVHFVRDIGSAFTVTGIALAGTVFIDRADRAKAIEALRPAIDALHSGLSIAIAPEGTRMPTPRLGRFKKGAFHIAMAAGVPIVPVVFRNTLDALPKHGIIVRPATIEVVIHPPIATTGWRHQDLNQRIAEVERLYADTLDI